MIGVVRRTRTSTRTASSITVRGEDIEKRCQATIMDPGLSVIWRRRYEGAGIEKRQVTMYRVTEGGVEEILCGREAGVYAVREHEGRVLLFDGKTTTYDVKGAREEADRLYKYLFKKTEASQDAGAQHTERYGEAEAVSNDGEVSGSDIAGIEEQI